MLEKCNWYKITFLTKKKLKFNHSSFLFMSSRQLINIFINFGIFQIYLIDARHLTVS
jgi:hypothetical protein